MIKRNLIESQQSPAEIALKAIPSDNDSAFYSLTNRSVVLPCPSQKNVMPHLIRVIPFVVTATYRAMSMAQWSQGVGATFSVSTVLADSATVASVSNRKFADGLLLKTSNATAGSRVNRKGGASLSPSFIIKFIVGVISLVLFLFVRTALLTPAVACVIIAFAVTFCFTMRATLYPPLDQLVEAFEVSPWPCWRIRFAQSLKIRSARGFYVASPANWLKQPHALAGKSAKRKPPETSRAGFVCYDLIGQGVSLQTG